MTFIPRKDEINGDEPDRNDNGLSQEQNDWLQAHGCKKLSEKEIAERNSEWDAQREKNKNWKFHTNWGRVAEETNFFGGLFVLIFYLSIFVNLFTFMASDGFLHSVPLAITLDVIVGIVLISALIEAGGLNFILQCIMSFIGGFADPSNVTLEDIEESKRRDAKKYQETADRCAKMWDKVHSANKPSDGKDFNTRQREKRKADAYASADPEFIVTYKSRGGCWVKDIVRGRDKAEVYNRYKFNPMVEYVGGVYGVLEGL